GIVFFIIYYFLFRVLIVKFNLKTPGREDKEVVEETQASEGEIEGDRFAIQGAKIYEGLGGDDNILSIDNCTTRLRVEVKDMEQVDQDKIKATNVPGVKVVGKHNIQVIVGTNVQFVADEMNKIKNK